VPLAECTDVEQPERADMTPAALFLAAAYMVLAVT
jgi:hypothetical protein